MNLAGVIAGVIIGLFSTDMMRLGLLMIGSPFVICLMHRLTGDHKHGLEMLQGFTDLHGAHQTRLIKGSVPLTYWVRVWSWIAMVVTVTAVLAYGFRLAWVHGGLLGWLFAS